MNDAQILKENGQNAVWENEHEKWRKMAMEKLKEYAERNEVVHAGDFRKWASVNGLWEPRHHNAWGSLYTRAAGQKWLRKTKIFKTSDAPRSHAHMCVVWESRIFNGKKSESKKLVAQELDFSVTPPNSFQNAKQAALVGELEGMRNRYHNLRQAICHIVNDSDVGQTDSMRLARICHSAGLEQKKENNWMYEIPS